jgi:hypothetical protein
LYPQQQEVIVKMTKSQRAKLAEGHTIAKKWYGMVVGRMNEDGTMTREVVTASSGRVLDSAVFTRRGRELVPDGA